VQPTKESIEATCPDCRGPLTIVRNGELLEVHCLVGHVYSAKGLLRAHSDAQEQALWGGVVALKEAGALVEAVRDCFSPEDVELLRAQARRKWKQAEEIERIIRELNTFDAS